MINNQALVSVIIIFYNGEKYIHEAINSVFAQTYPHWELLLCDDGSTDASTAIAHHYAASQPERIRYLEHPGHENRGMSATRNLGLRHAQGTYVALLDADDVWLPEKLAQQVAALEAHPKADMLYAPTEYWYSWTGRAHDQGRDLVPPLGLTPDTVIAPPTMLLSFLHNQAKPPGTCSVLMRREMIERVGGFVDSFRGMYEDQAFFAKVCLHVPVLVIASHSARYRQHPESACAQATTTNDYLPAEERYLRWLAGYIAQLPTRSGAEWHTLRRLLRPYRHPILNSLANLIPRIH